MNGCIYRMEDGKCKQFSVGGVLSFCYLDGKCDCQIPSNADRIRAMSDEELADSFASRCCPVKDEFYNCGEINKKEFSWEDCKSCWLDWLKSPVVDGND